MNEWNQRHSIIGNDSRECHEQFSLIAKCDEDQNQYGRAI